MERDRYAKDWEYVYFNDTVHEVCPFCDKEVELIAKWERQPCPNCGERIAPCTFCRDHHECSVNCYCGEE